MDAFNKVMIVDDTPANLKLLKEMLQRIGFDVSVFRSAIDAIEALDLNPPSIILMDISMPDMNGFEACKIIKANPVHKDTPIIFISALNDVEDKVKAFEYGGVDYITKPFEFEEVKMRVSTHLQISKLQKEIQAWNNSLERRVQSQLDEIEQTNKRLIRAQNSTIIALAKLSECRDTDTGLHLERVGHYCEILAKHLMRKNIFAEVDDDFIHTIKLVAPLHDIGKVGIPDKILLKPGRLEPDEFEIMKTHAQLGANTFLEVKKQMSETAYCEMAYDVILCHHEKYDGTGYPIGLSGNDIPLSARIMAVADVYDALRSKRPYKEPIPKEQAEQIIIDSCESHFAPELVEAFVENHDSLNQVAERLIDM